MSTNPYQSAVPLVAEEAARNRNTYQSTRWLVVINSVAMLALAGLYFVLAVTVYAFEPVLDAPDDVEFTGTLIFASLGIAGGACLLVLMLPVCALLFSLFVYASNKNARALGAQGMRFTPGWAVGWFYVPLANLYFPWAVMKELYLVSDPDRLPNPRPEGQATLVNAWWGSMIAHMILSMLEDLLQDGALARSINQATGLAAALAFLASAVLGAWMLHAISRRQEVARDRLCERSAAAATPAPSLFADRGA